MPRRLLGVFGLLLLLSVTPVAAADNSEWLNEINRYRVAAGVLPVTEEPAWVAGLENHLMYLEDTPAEYFTGSYASAHTENPESPYYTPSGALEAGSSDLLFGGGYTGVEAIDWWWAAPFHAIGMLRAQLAKVALANNPSSGFAGLDVWRGLSRPSSPTPILFPGPGMTTNLTRYGGNELPSPLETCGYTGTAPLGLPIIALMPQPPPAGVTATLAGPGGIESSGNGELCVVDASTYISTDPIYGPTGKQILEFDHAVILIPGHSFTDGVYEVAIHQPGDSDVTWSFTAQIAPPRNIIPPTIIGTPVERGVLFTNPGSWANEPTSYGYQWLRCNSSGSGCSPIAGVTTDAYEVAAADVGSTLRLEETAMNSSGISSVTTRSTSVVTASIGGGATVLAPRSRRPMLTSVHLSRRRFRIGKQVTAISARKASAGSSFRFTLSAAAKLQIKITRTVPGLRHGRSCLASSKKLRRAHAKRCTRTLTLATLTRANEPTGADSVPFSGRIGGRALGPGSYRATLSASNTAGRSKPVARSFTIVQ